MIYKKRKGVPLFRQLHLLHPLLPSQTEQKRGKIRGRAQWVRVILFSCVITCMCFRCCLFEVSLIPLCCEFRNFCNLGEKRHISLQNESLEISVSILPPVFNDTIQSTIG